jgi:hypothetical protein
VSQVYFKEYVVEGGQKLFPKRKTVPMYYLENSKPDDGICFHTDEDDDVYCNCDGMFTFMIKKKSRWIMCVDFNEEKSDLRLQSMGLHDKSFVLDKLIYRIHRCFVGD